MKLLITAVVAALVLVSAAGSARDFTLRPAAQTDKTVTFSWPRQQGADGYLFLRNGILVARTMNGSATSATFWKGSRYAVSVLHVAKGGRVTRGPSAAFVPSRAIRAARTHGATRKTRLVFVAAPSPNSRSDSSTGRGRPSRSRGRRNPELTGTGSSVTALSSRGR